MENLVKRYYNKVYTYVLSKVESEVQAKDIIQDVFLNFLKVNSRIEEIKNPDAYLMSMAKNAIIKNSKTIKTIEISTLHDSMDHLTSNIPRFEGKFEAKDLHEKLEEFVTQLPNRQREVFELSRKKGLSHHEIAEKLNLSSHTVNNHLVQALKTIRKRYTVLI